MSFFFALAAALLTAEPSSPPLEQFYDQITQKRAKIQALKAEYEERNLLQEETFTTRGKLLYLKPQRIIRQTEDPLSSILVDGRTGYLYEPEIKQLQVFNIDDDPQSDILFLGFDEDVRKLEEAYDVKLLQQEKARGLLITPKFNPYKDPLFEELSILFEEEYLLPERIEVINQDGSKTIYLVDKLQVNPPIDPAESQIALAEGTRIIEENETRETVGAGGKLVPAPAQQPAPAPAAADANGQATGAIRTRELAPVTPGAAQ